MITRDYHGFKVIEAINNLESLIDGVRQERKTIEVEVVTGFGQIRTEVFQKLLDYGLDPSYKLGNDGTIYCVIE